MINTRMFNAKRFVQVKHVVTEHSHFLIVTLDRILRRGDERLRDHQVLLPREHGATDLWSGGRRGQRLINYSAHRHTINTRRCEMKIRRYTPVATLHTSRYTPVPLQCVGGGLEG
jgi:hypothetical protein